MESRRDVDVFAERLFQFGSNVTLVTYNGLTQLWDEILRLRAYVVGILGLASYGLFKLFSTGKYISALCWLWPALLHGRSLFWLRFGAIHGTSVFAGLAYCFVLVLGARRINRLRRLNERFEAIGLTNRFGHTPKLIDEFWPDEFTKRLVLNAMSIDVSQFENKKEALEAAFGMTVEKITRPKDLRNIEIIFSTKSMPTFVHFAELNERAPLKPGHFYLGECRSGIHSVDLATTPHVLIAGTTGGGKSNFFKQAIAGLLKATDRIQFYVLDLKRGIEAKDFEEAPNVSVAKSIDEAFALLSQIQDQMERRFQFLESSGHKGVDPDRDELDRMVVAVDEAAELYAMRAKSDPEYDAIMKCQEITNAIARLGRAAGIHLILATQKVTKESINTVIQENVATRVCFRMNTLQGSLQVLGSKDAMELPSIPGRAICDWGSERKEIQTPFLRAEEIKNICSEAALDFEIGNKTLAKPIIKLSSSPMTDGQSQSPIGLLDHDA